MDSRREVLVAGPWQPSILAISTRCRFDPHLALAGVNHVVENTAHANTDVAALVAQGAQSLQVHSLFHMRQQNFCTMNGNVFWMWTAAWGSRGLTRWIAFAAQGCVEQTGGDAVIQTQLQGQGCVLCHGPHGAAAEGDNGKIPLKLHRRWARCGGLLEKRNRLRNRLPAHQLGFRPSSCCWNRCPTCGPCWKTTMWP